MGDTLAEELHVNQFLSLINISTVVTRCEPPDPDFTLFSMNKTIGIEHTRLFLDNESNGLIKHRVSANRIMERAEAQFKAKRMDKLTVHVYFKCSYGLSMPEKMLTGKDVPVLSEFICKFVDANCPAYGSNITFQQFDMRMGIQVLPDFITRISIYNKYNCWSAAQGGVVPYIGGAELAHSVKSKDVKLSNYTSIYDEVWLLIVENQWDLTTYFDFSYADNIEVDSSYNRVFILRSGNDEVKECVNLRPEEQRWNGIEFRADI